MPIRSLTSKVSLCWHLLPFKLIVCLQFFYDPSGVGKPMRSWLCVQLGTWHPYKQANTLLWTHWSARIFAPLFNELISNANFQPKARLSTIAKFLTIVRLAFPSFRTNLEDALRHQQQLNTNRVAVSHLRDLKKLLEFFIPVVRNSCG